MKSLTVRGVDEEVYRGLQALAKENRRSLQEQVKMILEREVRLIQGSRVPWLQEMRKRLADRPWGNIAAEIREERER